MKGSAPSSATMKGTLAGGARPAVLRNMLRAGKGENCGTHLALLSVQQFRQIPNRKFSDTWLRGGKRRIAGRP